MTEIKGWISEGTFLVFDHRLVLSLGHFFLSFFMIGGVTGFIWCLVILVTSLYPGEEFVSCPSGEDGRISFFFFLYDLFFFVLRCVFRHGRLFDVEWRLKLSIRVQILDSCSFIPCLF